MEEKFHLDTITYSFFQEGNTNGTTEQEEHLTVTVESVLSSIDEEGGFLTIRTETGWSVNDANEFLELLRLVEKGVKTQLK